MLDELNILRMIWYLLINAYTQRLVRVTAKQGFRNGRTELKGFINVA